MVDLGGSPGEDPVAFFQPHGGCCGLECSRRLLDQRWVRFGCWCCCRCPFLLV